MLVGSLTFAYIRLYNKIFVVFHLQVFQTVENVDTVRARPNQGPAQGRALPGEWPPLGCEVHVPLHCPQRAESQEVPYGALRPAAPVYSVHKGVRMRAAQARRVSGLRRMLAF